MGYSTQTIISQLGIQAAEETQWIPWETLDIDFGIKGLSQSWLSIEE